MARDVERDVVGQEGKVQGAVPSGRGRDRWGRLFMVLLVWSFVLTGCGDDAECAECVHAALSDGSTADGSVAVDGGLASSDGSVGEDASSDGGAPFDGASSDGDVPDGGEDVLVFTPTDWNGVKQVVVTGVDDAAQDGYHPRGLGGSRDGDHRGSGRRRSGWRS